MFSTIRTIYCLHRFYLPFPQLESIEKKPFFFLLSLLQNSFYNKLESLLDRKILNISERKSRSARRVETRSATSWNMQRATSPLVSELAVLHILWIFSI